MAEDSRKIKILIADDEPDIIVITKARLEKSGFEVVTCPDGEGCLKLAQDLPDVILLDIQMPGIDGYEVLRRLKNGESTKSIPVIMLSASSSEDALKKTLEAGAAGYVLKPFDPGALIETIRKAVK